MRTHYITRKIDTMRLGFHYFADTNHYTNKDLNTWLPRLTGLSTHWLVLLADATRAIPENFIHGIIDAGITPVVHISLPLPNTPSSNDMRAIIEAYARWGIKHIILFDQPNATTSWSASGWSQPELVERFIDRFLPLALTVAQSGMTPVFPPLKPGGDYWDLSFLKQALKSIQRRGHVQLVKKLMLAAYAYTFDHDIDWGTGAEMKWQKVLPYHSNDDSQDQKGFNQYQWLEEISADVCGQELPVILLGAGMQAPGVQIAPDQHAELVISIVERLNGIPKAKQISGYVEACCFYILGAEPGTDEYKNAWYKTGNESLPVVSLLTHNYGTKGGLVEPQQIPEADNRYPDHPISHYLLLPLYEWGVADFHLDVTRSFIKKNHPTVGFSIDEARLARKVTVLGGEDSFSDEVLIDLRNSGCVVERISGDGTSIATQLAER
jgi:hypothetical protein